MKLIIVTLATLFTSTSLFASDFGSIDEATRLQWEEQRVVDLVGASSDYRASINKGRSIAGQTASELKWAQEFETLMNSKNDDNTDYLELALKL